MSLTPASVVNRKLAMSIPLGLTIDQALSSIASKFRFQSMQLKEKTRSKEPFVRSFARTEGNLPEYSCLQIELAGRLGCSRFISTPV